MIAIRYRPILAALLAASTVLHGCGARAPLRVEHAWVRAAGVGGTTAAYFELVNDRADSAVVTGVTGELAAALQMHETVRAHGVVSMREAARLVVPPHGRLAFAPGGDHVMLVALRRRLAPGDRANLTLLMSDGVQVVMVAEVRE